MHYITTLAFMQYFEVKSNSENDNKTRIWIRYESDLQ